MKDITNTQDIQLLVNTFYDSVRQSEIGFFFEEIVPVNWEKHLPKMYLFWQALLFADVKFDGNPMGAHFPINEKMAMEKRHFETWLNLWKSTVDQLFSGEIAESAKSKAENIANLMAYKMEMDTKLRKS
ncbi:group III truncated hemoglobin [Cloacibacterium sp. TD35]|uniref:group III truncated hemoglobin n=1 Tax=Cloacibacterium sp. TD35 TaxID=2976818 RepID=UPI00237DD65F|nr:group III truncated hemoglobin [Cloacibacterium sp. TD35]WDT68650.1 group III truncated hemoglobin [Cloacibacterium sp. TD35]